jgi:hypothetical protein
MCRNITVLRGLQPPATDATRRLLAALPERRGAPPTLPPLRRR